MILSLLECKSTFILLFDSLSRELGRGGGGGGADISKNCCIVMYNPRAGKGREKLGNVFPWINILIPMCVQI